MKSIEPLKSQYDRLTIIAKQGKDINSRNHWLCRCSCNKITIVREDHLKSGHTKSCGCLRGINNRKAYVPSN